MGFAALSPFCYTEPSTDRLPNLPAVAWGAIKTTRTSHAGRVLIGEPNRMTRRLLDTSTHLKAIDARQIKRAQEFEFHKQEHTQLRSEIDSYGIEGTRIQILTIVALATYFYFGPAVIKEFSVGLKIFSYWAPMLILAFGYNKQKNNEIFISTVIVVYLRRIEEIYANQDITGWENFLNLRKEEDNWDTNYFFSARKVFWGVLFVIVISIALYRTFNDFEVWYRYESDLTNFF